jgi:RNA polymerase sigma-70 factor (ECF subfamily)
MRERAKAVANSLAAARSGSLEALGQTLDAYRAYLLAIAERELDPQLKAKGGASDLVQETLLDAVGSFKEFRGKSDAELKAWLRRLLLHNVIDFTRQYRDAEKREVARERHLGTGTSSSEVSPEVADSGPSPSGAAARSEQANAIQKAMEKLPEDYRRVIVLRYHEERSFDDIGQLMNLSANAARKLWARAIKRLRQESQEHP